MLILVHGENSVASFKERDTLIKRAKDKGREVVYLEAKTLEVTDLIQATQKESLFGGEKLIVIDGLHSLPKSKRQTALIQELALVQDQPLLVYETKALTAAQKKKLGQITEKEFKTSTVIFKYLESLGSVKPQQMITLLCDAVEKDSAEMVFYMLARHLRQLLQALEGDVKGPTWLQGKLKKQAANIGQEKLLQIHEDMLHIDINIKTGKSMIGLDGELEVLMLKHFS